MLKLVANILLRTILLTGFALWALGITATSRAEHGGCLGVSLAEGTKRLETKYGEVPTIMAPLLNREYTMVIFASSKGERTWTLAVLDTRGCLSPVMSGTDWPLEVPNSGAGDDAKVVL